MNLKKLIVVSLFSTALMLMGCEKEGPMEDAGGKVDNVIEKTGETVEEAEEKMDSAIEKAGDTMEEAKEKMDSAIEKAGDTVEDAGDKIKDTTN
ncbi:hypothetical protein DO021_21740 [Desulfobacter hydrogenophilus]|uniref:YtxH domain-containing protein n=1 Tax=Desulfobacter hydrogenophilus TaxID=2291 RepID=A0A328F647_9BACT|nr:hypothetical protein [Desulfobacter hydrogenophilus]NDY74502.1 hypothetical protein [Desulfobacter hydrogenophilus]QBH15172.1 hypothetical protein EYB58_20960 [Desulfobacter hydrogenophilus]RAL99947.1 hypothetical protein DO021_21740 [Desulfobacter hydrogenophilus]